MQTTIYDRINMILERENLSRKKFAEKIKIPQTTISNYFTRGTEPSIIVVQQIINSFEYINIEWLVTGKGEMIKSESTDLNDIESKMLKMISELSAENAILKHKLNNIQSEKMLNIAAEGKEKYGGK